MPSQDRKKSQESPFGVPADYDLLRVWIADRYQIDRHEIAHEYGLDPEPTYFEADDIDGNDGRAAREWLRKYYEVRDSDPERFRRIIAKITLSYADTFLEMAGIKRPEPIPPGIYVDPKDPDRHFEVTRDGRRVDPQ